MFKSCKICKQVKSIDNFFPCGTYKGKQYYRGDCGECHNSKRRGKNLEYHKEYKQRPEVKERIKKYKKSEKYLESSRKRSNERYYNDPVYKLKKCLRVRLKYTLKHSQFTKDASTEEYIGCSYEELKKHIESQFNSQMTWENHGILWEIEHIQPLGLAKTQEELYKLSHYSNIRPMLIEEHKFKSIEDTKQILDQRKKISL